MQSLPVVDIVIPTRNRGALIEATLTSLRASQDVDLTIWVVDQSDGDATALVVAAHVHKDARVRYISTTTRGISAARNIGVRAGTAPIVLFTDDDCEVDPRWAAELAAELEHPDTWAAFGRVIGVWPELNGPDTVTPGIELATKLFPHRTVYAQNPYNLSFGHGASMGVRRTALAWLGGFDEALGTGGSLRSWEDRDFGYRALSAGGQIVYTPRALLYHHQWRDWPAVRRTCRDYGIGAGAAAAKYLRCGDPGGAVLLGDWLFNQGLRQIISGLFKWRSWQKIQVGLIQLSYPWKGALMGMRYTVDPQHRLYSHVKQQVVAAATESRSPESR